MNNAEIQRKMKSIKGKIEKWIEQGRLREAKKALDDYEVMIPGDPEICSMRAVIHIIEGSLDKAESALEKGLEKDTTQFDLLFNLAYIRELEGKTQEAANLYCKAKTVAYEDAQKQNVNEAISRIKSNNENIEIKEKSRIVFFVKAGMNNFFEDIIIGLSDDYWVRKITVSDFKQIDAGMEWADVCWFEWCDELIIYGSKLALARRKNVICRIPGSEICTEQINKANWSNIDRVVVVDSHIKSLSPETILSLSNVEIDLFNENHNSDGKINRVKGLIKDLILNSKKARDYYAKQRQLTVIIPTRNRYELLKRCLYHFISMNCSKLEITIMVLDASNQKTKTLNAKLVSDLNLNFIVYRDFDENVELQERITYGLGITNSEYCCICADDDFLIKEGLIESIDILESNPGIATVRGQSTVFLNNDLSKKFIRSIDIPVSITEEKIIDRLNTLSKNRITQTIYSVFRTRDLLRIYENIVSMEGIDKLNLVFREYLFYFFVVIIGKIVVTSECTNLRDYSNDSATFMYENFYDTIANGTFNAHYMNFRRMLIKFLVLNNVFSEELDKKINIIFCQFIENSLLIPNDYIRITDTFFDLELLLKGQRIIHSGKRE